MNRFACLAATVAVVLAAGSAVAAPGASTPLARAESARVTPVRGDFDGDGRADLALGAPGHNRVRISYTHASPHHAYLTTSAPSHFVTKFGSALATGDFDGDGFGDLAVAAPNYASPNEDTSVFPFKTEGAVFIFLGSSSGLVEQPLKIVGPNYGGQNFHLGAALAAADIDGDGRTDLAARIDSLGAQGDQGVNVYYATASGFDRHHKQNLAFGAEGIAFGDVNGDGRTDLVTGEIDELGGGDVAANEVVVYNGSASGRLAKKRHVIRGKALGLRDNLQDGRGDSRFGASIAVGDVNGDGFADVVAGAPLARKDGQSHGPGSIVLLLGGKHDLSVSRHQIVPESALHTAHGVDRFGLSVAVAKIGADKFADVVVGAPGTAVNGHSQAGAVYFLNGSKHGLLIGSARRFTQATKLVAGGASTGGLFGARLFVAQFGGNAYRDLIASAPGEKHDFAHSGYVVELRGAVGGLTGAHSAGVSGAAKNDRLGTGIA